MAERRGREVRAAGRLEVGEVGAVERPAQLLHRVGHATDARATVGAVGLQPLGQPGVAGIDPVPEDVKVLAERVDRRELDRWDEPDPVLARGGLRLGDAVDGVVVAQREQLDPRAGRRGDDPGGHQRAVGVHGVRLQVERRRGHGRAA